MTAFKQQVVLTVYSSSTPLALVLCVLHYITLLCGTRSLMAMESRAIAGGLSADQHQLPGVPNAKEVLLCCVYATPCLVLHSIGAAARRTAAIAFF
jgi:hypothetical protein